MNRTRKTHRPKGKYRAHTRAHTRSEAASGFQQHVSVEKGRERGVGLDDIMCCYSPAEGWQEDF